LENLAAINGKKLKPSPMDSPLNLTSDERKEADRQAKKMLERMKTRAFEKERLQKRLDIEADAQRRATKGGNSRTTN